MKRKKKLNDRKKNSENREKKWRDRRRIYKAFNCRKIRIDFIQISDIRWLSERTKTSIYAEVLLI